MRRSLERSLDFQQPTADYSHYEVWKVQESVIRPIQADFPRISAREERGEEKDGRKRGEGRGIKNGKWDRIERDRKGGRSRWRVGKRQKK